MLKISFVEAEEGAKQEGKQKDISCGVFTLLDTMVWNNLIIQILPDIEGILIRWESQ